MAPISADLHTVAFMLDTSYKLAPSLWGMQILLDGVQACLKQTTQPRVLFITTGAYSFQFAKNVDTPVNLGAAHGGVWGFSRVLRMEVPKFQTRCIEMDQASLPDVRDSLLRDVVQFADPEIGYMRSYRYWPRVLKGAAVKSRKARDLVIPRLSSYALTGGLGGLGLRTSQWLHACGTGHLVLGSRSGKVARGGQGSEQILDSLVQMAKGPSLVVDIHKCDAGVCEDVQALVDIAHTPPLRGVFHMTEQLRDKLARNLLSDDFAASFGAKSVGSSFLHGATSQLCMASTLWFSSGAAMWGFVGSGTHAASCGYCEAAGFARSAMGLTHHTVALNPVYGAGSGEAHGTTSASTTITIDQFLAILGSAMVAGHVSAASTTMPRPCPADLKFLLTKGTDHPRSLWRAAPLARRRGTATIAAVSLDASVPPQVLPPRSAEVRHQHNQNPCEPQPIAN